MQANSPLPAFLDKICQRTNLPLALRTLPKPWVFTNGVFDVLHRGHVMYLAQARALGGSLIVALNTDASVRRLGKGDDRPLNITDVRFLQLQRTLIAELQPGMRYTITTGDPKKSAPRYDIVHFKDKLPEPIAIIEHGTLIALAATPEGGPSIAPARWWIWAGLVVVLGLVGFMAVRMLSDHNNKTDST